MSPLVVVFLVPISELAGFFPWKPASQSIFRFFNMSRKAKIIICRWKREHCKRYLDLPVSRSFSYVPAGWNYVFKMLSKRIEKLRPDTGTVEYHTYQTVDSVWSYSGLSDQWPKSFSCFPPSRTTIVPSRYLSTACSEENSNRKNHYFQGDPDRRKKNGFLGPRRIRRSLMQAVRFVGPSAALSYDIESRSIGGCESNLMNEERRVWTNL